MATPRTNLIKIITDIKQPIQSVTDLEKRLKTLRKALKDSPKEGTAAFKQLAVDLSKNLNISVDESKRKIREWSASATKEAQQASTAIKEYNRTLRNIKPPKNTLQSLRDELRKAETEFKNITIGTQKFADKQASLKKLRDRIFEIEKATGDARRGVGQYERAFGKLGASVTKFAAVAGVGLGVSELVQAGKAGIKIFADFGQQIATLGAVSGATGDDLAALREQSIAYGSATQFTATQVAELQTALARLGFSSAEILASTEAVGNVAIATGEDIGESAKVIGQSIRAYGLSADDAGRVSDVLAASFNSSALQLTTFAEASKLVAPVARILGVSLEETTSAIGLLADNGLEGTIATQTIGSALQKLADENGKYAKAAKDAGAEAFNQAGEFVGLNQFVQNLTEATKDYTDQERLATLSKIVGVQASKNFAILLNGTKEVVTETGKQTLVGADALNYYTGQLQTSGGAAAETAAKVGDTLAQDFLKLQSAVEGATIRLLDSRENGLRGFVQGITEAVPVIGRFISEGLGKVQEILKELIDPIIVFGQAWSQILKVFGLAGKEGAALGGILEFLAFTTRLAFTPIRIVINLISKWVDIVGNLLTFGRALITVIDDKIGVFSKLAGWFDIAGEKAGFFVSVVQTVAGAVGKTFDKVLGYIDSTVGRFDFIAKRIDGIRSFFGEVGDEFERLKSNEVIDAATKAETRAERANRITQEQRRAESEKTVFQLEKEAAAKQKAANAGTKAAGKKGTGKDTTTQIKTEAELAAGSIAKLSKSVSDLEKQIQDAPPEIIPNLIPQLNEAKGLLDEAQQALARLQNPSLSFEEGQRAGLDSTLQQLTAAEQAIIRSAEYSEEQKDLIKAEFDLNRQIESARVESVIIAEQLRLQQLSTDERLALEQRLTEQTDAIRTAELEKVANFAEQTALLTEEQNSRRVDALKRAAAAEISELEQVRQKVVDNDKLTNKQRTKTLEQYAEQRKLIEDRLEVDLLRLQISTLEKGSAERLALEQQLADKEFQIRAALYKKDAAAAAESEQKKAQIREQLTQAGFQLAQKISDTAFTLNEQRIKNESDTKIAALDSQLQTELALVEGNEAAQAALTAEYERRKEAIEKEAAKKRKRAAIVQAIINGALAITNILATVPKFDFGVASAIQVGLAAATTAAQVAIISAQKFARGGQFNPTQKAPARQFARGGYLNKGTLHSQNNGMPIINPNTGDVAAYIERDEAIVNRRAMLSGKQMTLSGTPLDIVSHINSSTGGVKYAGAKPVSKYQHGTARFGVSRKVKKLARGAVVASIQGRQIQGFDNSILEEMVELQKVAIVSNEQSLNAINGTVASQQTTAEQLREISQLLKDADFAEG